MPVFRIFMVIALALTLSGCASKFKTYNGPEVTQVLVKKGERRMYLLHGSEVLKSYRIDLGFEPQGHKAVEGDGKTPEGLYFINRRNANSRFHLSLGISYPNPQDRALAAELGKSAGGDIFIHGGPPKGSGYKRFTDWTWGCIAVSDAQIEDIYAMVKNGTPILIRP
ncbi:MAG: L,D-transpeptidase family protein [Pseudomonadota bacterium]|uniref:L,D-transpeptidase family protein n=1 Tax=Thalassococcus sp. TaxID=1928858 RepID=UPI001B2575AF|nr:L,D-transpeptidase family protein [Thalassococcus sp.]MBO6865939.1 L,D-transpeptidase family protein [Thalassococcus sp.]MEE3359020.1 L,D-transpeptidase family protein [Pseudomonadota bacterium]